MASPILHVCVGLALLNLFKGFPGGAGGPPANGEIRPPSIRVRRGGHRAAPLPPLAPSLAAAILACLPDLDYLPGLLRGNWNLYHQGPTHSLLFLLLATAAALLLLQLLPAGWRSRASLPSPTPRVAALVFALIASHLAIDWMTQDFRPPIGCPWLWPLSDHPFHAPFAFIPAWKKLRVIDLFSTANLYPIAVETLLGAATLALTFLFPRPRKT